MNSFIKDNLLNKKVKIENTKSLRFTYTVGYFINADIVYELNLQDNKYIAYHKIVGVKEEEKLKKEINKDIVLEIENILKKYKVYKWNGFNKSDKNVLDGNSFYFTYTNGNNENIHASGSMMYPSNYRDFKADIDTLFEDLFKEEIKKQKTTLK